MVYDSGMKKFLVFFFPFLFLFALPFGCARRSADAASLERYAVADSEAVWFYGDETETSKLFLVPYTYYVRVLAVGDPFSTVEYLTDDAPYRKVFGYCKTDALTFVDFVPARPYLRREIEVRYDRPTAGELGGPFDSTEKTFVFYGYRYEGAQLYYYVLCDGTFGYLAMDDTLDFPLNTDYLEAVDGSHAEAAPAGGLSPAAIALICVGCAAAVAIAAFVLRGKKKSPPSTESDF